MEQYDQHNEEQFGALLEKLSTQAWEKPLLIAICPQPSWAISVIEQLNEEVEAVQIVLDWQAKQIDSFDEYLEESGLGDTLSQSSPDIVHIVGLENSLLTELLELENEVMKTWDGEIEIIQSLSERVVLWVDMFTGGKIRAEANNISDNIEDIFNFLIPSKLSPKEPNEEQFKQIKQWETEEDWLELGNLWLELEDKDQVSIYVTKAIERIGRDTVKSAKTHLLHGRYLDMQELWQMAVTSYKIAYDNVIESDDQDLTTQICFRIANLFATHDRPQIALEWYEKAIDAGKESSPVFVAKSHRNIGILQAQDGDIDSSFEHLEQALDGLEENEEWDSLAFTHQQVAEIFVNLQQIGDAIEHHQAAAVFFGQIEDYLSQGNNFERIARLGHYKGKMKTAIDNYGKAIEAYKKGEGDKKVADTYQRLGALHQDQLNWTEALSSFQGALPYAEKLEDDFMVESLKDSIENMEAKTSASKKKGKGLFGGLFGKK